MTFEHVFVKHSNFILIIRNVMICKFDAPTGVHRRKAEVSIIVVIVDIDDVL